jgi:ATP-binding cassette subfamily F protein 3
VGYLPQGHVDQPGLAVDSAIPELARRRELERQVARLAIRLAQEKNPPTSLANAYEAALEDLAASSKAVEGGIRPLLQQWGLGSLDYARPVASLSGGEKTRLGLARVLARRPDILLLDEPTNHLDLEGIEDLEAWLADFAGALVLVTHDRALLSTVPTSLLELSPEGGRWRCFSGVYTAFLETKERELEQQRSAFGRQDRQVRRGEGAGTAAEAAGVSHRGRNHQLPLSKAGRPGGPTGEGG